MQNAKKKYPQRIKKPINADDMFKLLHDFMAYNAHPYLEQQKVWDALTGLRGPDGGGDARYLDKRATTAVIRHKIFGSDSGAENFAEISEDSDKQVERRSRNQMMKRINTGDHFIEHARRAFKALDLEWYTINK
jgi:hypothetical protein